MEILLWLLIPLLVCTLTIYSWIVRDDVVAACALSLAPTILLGLTPLNPATARFWGTHGPDSGSLINSCRPSGIGSGKAASRALHWTVYPANSSKQPSDIRVGITAQ